MKVGTTRAFKIVVLISVFISGYAFGLISHRYEVFPYYYLKQLVERPVFASLSQFAGFDVTYGRTALRCDQIPQRPLVLLTLGQSNAANSGSGRFDAASGVYNFNLFDGRCYEARDPLLGASGDGGSAWIPLAQMLIENGLAEAVVVAPIAVSGSHVADWAPGGVLAERIARAIGVLASTGLQVDALLWHQGESDRGTAPAMYTESFLRMVGSIRGAGVSAPIYVAQATRCDAQEDATLREAQAQLGALHAGVRQGPNTDALVGEKLRDGCHFTRLGTFAHAALWFEVLKRDLPVSTGAVRRFG
jgi:hypothetical protein